MTAPKDAELLRLLGRLVDNELSEADARRLAERLSAASARRAYLQYMDAHARLLLYFDAISPAPPEQAAKRAVAVAVRTAQAAYRYLTRPTPFSITIAAVVVGLLVAAMALVVPPVYRNAIDGGGNAATSPPQPVAEVANLHQVQWAHGQAAARTGQRLLAGQRLELGAGVVEITYASGASVAVQGPAVYTVGTGPDAENSGTLLAGSLHAHVPPGARGFTLATPSTVLIDRGTEFGAVVDADKTTEICVFEGRVEVRPGGASGDGQGAPRGASLIVGAGRSARFSAEAPWAEEIPFDPEGFAAMRALLPPPDEAPPPLRTVWSADFAALAAGREGPGRSFDAAAHGWRHVVAPQDLRLGQGDDPSAGLILPDEPRCHIARALPETLSGTVHLTARIRVGGERSHGKGLVYLGPRQMEKDPTAAVLGVGIAPQMGICRMENPNGRVVVLAGADEESVYRFHMAAFLGADDPRRGTYRMTVVREGPPETVVVRSEPIPFRNPSAEKIDAIILLCLEQTWMHVLELSVDTLVD